MGYRTLWTNTEIKSWARAYLKKNVTLITLESAIDVCHSTLWWCFTHRLEDIDFDLYERVLNKLNVNKHKGGRRCRTEK